ncbi:alpha/beta hydrolase [Natronosporangium hydrolyticum]|uniref:Alpha/beta hydrolase n=1 Tax=Natronosporangium hydrolyticum TaxID=2811111 RepID=A0A895Y8G9_9ACTN|nr:alpha/beta hydrolase [Natronosporangium hydrolyticum]QSB14024.1 alpha/beta hydrolase [Natronosporangium hydrolyticum]
MTNVIEHGRLRRGTGWLAVAMALSAVVACAQEPPETPEPPETTRVEVEGATLAYQSLGPAEAETVLLVAGTGMQLIDWPDGLVEGLVDAGFRVVRFDNRDVGLTSMPGELEPIDPVAIGDALEAGEPAPVPYTFDDLAGDALGLLDALDVPQAHVVGMSMGGAIAQLIAIDAPQRVASLTLLAADSGNPELPDVADNFAELPPPPAPDDLDAVVDYRVTVAQVLAGPGYPTDEATIRARERAAADRAYDPEARTRQEVISLVGHLETAAYRLANLANIAAPTMVLHGTDDPLVPVAAAYDLDAAIPDSELQVIPGWGHDLPDQLTAKFVDAISAIAARSPVG